MSLRPARDEKLIEIIDRVLDRGVIVDASVKVSIAGISLLGIETHVEMVAIERGPASALERGVNSARTGPAKPA